MPSNGHQKCLDKSLTGDAFDVNIVVDVQYLQVVFITNLATFQ